MQVRTFTLEEANRLLPEVRDGLAKAKSILDRLRTVRDQLTDLRIVWEDKILDPECPDHPEYEAYRAEFSALESEMSHALGSVTALGCEVKDPDAGLVDFYAQRGSDVVYLCWRRGEPSIQYWHTLAEGFAGRKPITSF